MSTSTDNRARATVSTRRPGRAKPEPGGAPLGSALTLAAGRSLGRKGVEENTLPSQSLASNRVSLQNPSWVASVTASQSLCEPIYQVEKIITVAVCFPSETLHPKRLAHSVALNKNLIVLFPCTDLSVPGKGVQRLGQAVGGHTCGSRVCWLPGHRTDNLNTTYLFPPGFFFSPQCHGQLQQAAECFRQQTTFQ